MSEAANSGGSSASAIQNIERIEQIHTKLIDEFTKWYTQFINTLKKKADSSPNRKTFTQGENYGVNHLQKVEILVLAAFNEFFRAQRGGAVTYSLEEGEDLTKGFEGNEFKGLSPKDNILILGGGPNGLYMGLMLRRALPQIEVNILENRVIGNKRTLTREGVVRVYGGIISSREPAKTFREIITDISPELLLFLVGNQNILNYFAILSILNPTAYKPNVLHDYTEIKTNTLEFFYANAVQQLGANIYHDSDPANIKKYINSNTLCVFDATGGRFRKVIKPSGRSYWNNFSVGNVSRVYNNTSMPFLGPMRNRVVRNSEDKTKTNFSIYEGYLSPDLSINKIGETPYVAIGDTTLRTDYRKGLGLFLNSTLIITYVLLLKRLYNGLQPAVATGPAVNAGPAVNTGSAVNTGTALAAGATTATGKANTASTKTNVIRPYPEVVKCSEGKCVISGGGRNTHNTYKKYSKSKKHTKKSRRHK